MEDDDLLTPMQKAEMGAAAAKAAQNLAKLAETGNLYVACISGIRYEYSAANHTVEQATVGIALNALKFEDLSGSVELCIGTSVADVCGRVARLAQQRHLAKLRSILQSVSVEVQYVEILPKLCFGAPTRTFGGRLMTVRFKDSSDDGRLEILDGRRLTGPCPSGFVTSW